MVKFFNKEEEEQIIGSIRELENQTSGEIRIHLAQYGSENVFKDAQKTFVKLGMHQTRERNGVLFYLVPKQHQFAILGDEGINRQVPANFWDDVRDIAQAHFQEGRFAEGICRAVDRIGEKLKAHFPPREDDENELPDEVSYD
jgi:uncharacterized membrane protein